MVNDGSRNGHRGVKEGSKRGGQRRANDGPMQISEWPMRDKSETWHGQ